MLVKKVECWLLPTTADQCGQNPAIDLRTYSQNLMHCLPVVCVTSAASSGS